MMNARQAFLSDARRSGFNRPQLRAHLPINRTAKDDSQTRSAAGSGRREAASSNSADLELIGRAIGCDPTAHEQLFKIHAAKLYRTAFVVLRNKQDAEDALQKSWCWAYANLKSFEGRSSFSTWLTRIVINSALMILRKNRRARQVFADPSGAGCRKEIP